MSSDSKQNEANASSNGVRAMLSVLLIVFFGAFYIGGLLLIDLFFGRPINPFVIFLIALLTFSSFFLMLFLKNYIESRVNSLFYKDKFEVQQLLNDIRKIIASKLTLVDLCQALLEDLITQMKITAGFIMLMKSNNIVWLKGVGKHTFSDLDDAEFSLLIEKAYNNRPDRALIYEKVEDSNVKTLMKKYGLSVILPLVAENIVIGAMCFSEKISKEPYSNDEIHVLDVLSAETALAVRNALSFEEMKQFNIILKEEVKKATEDLQKANERLQELDKLKDEFVSIASHELRTPMTAIKSYLWMALNKSQGLTPELSHYILIAYQSTEHLLDLVKNMLTVSRIEAKRLQLNMEQFNIVELAQQLYEELRITADEKQISFLLLAEPNAIMINGDKEKIREVIENLLGNALKYTPSKGVIKTIIHIENNQAVIKINNTGSYISGEQLAKLFSKFVRLDDTTPDQNHPQGTGLGLYIAKQIIELHKGTVQAASDKIEGTTFTFTIPTV